MLLPRSNLALKEETFTWEPGDWLLLYTDGLSEARDSRDEFLPLLDLAPLLVTGDVEAALDNLLDHARRHVPHGDLGDDVAVVLLERPLNHDGGAT